MRTILAVAFATLLSIDVYAQSPDSIFSARRDAIFRNNFNNPAFDAVSFTKATLDTILQDYPSSAYHEAFWKGRVGVSFLQKQQSDSAIAYLIPAKTYFSQRKNARSSVTLATMCQYLGFAYHNQRKFDKAKTEFFEAVKILKNNETQHGKFVRGQVYTTLTNTLAESGEHDTLVLITKEAIAFMENNLGKEVALIGNIHQNVGKSYFNQGMYPEAEVEFKAAFAQYNLNEVNRQSSKSEMGNILSNIGGMRFEMGDYDEAINYCARAIAFLDSMGFASDAPEYLNAYGNIAHAFRALGKLKKAEGYFLKMIEILERKADVLADVFATTYDGLGQTYMTMDLPDSARAIYRKGLSLVREQFGYKWQTSFMEFNIGKAYFVSRQFDSASTYLDAAIETYRRAGGGKPVVISEAYRILAEVSLSHSHWSKALQLLDTASLVLSDTTNIAQADFESRSWEAIFLTKAQLYFQKHKSRDRQPGDLDRAYNNLQFANQWLSRHRINLSVYNPEILQNILTHTHLAEAILWEMYQANPSQTLADKMFETADRSKSRVLFEQFRFFNAIQSGKLPADTIKKLNAEMNLWRGKIAALSDNTFAQKDVRIRYQSKLAELKSQRDSLLGQYQDFTKRHREPPGTTRAQTQDLLDPDQCLVEFVVADSVIYIFLLRRDRMFPPIVVPKDGQFSDWVRTVRDICSTPILEPAGEDSVRQAVTRFSEAALGLYNLLIDPIRSHLTKRVTVVRDGELNYIPFEVLVDTTGEAYFDDLSYLLHRFVFSYENTAALYREVRQRDIKPADSLALVLSPFADWGYDKWRKLPKTAEQIPNLCFLAKGCDPRLGVKATKSVLTTEGPRYRFIHLSAHAKANDSTGQNSFILFRKPNSNSYDMIPPDTLFAAEVFGLDFQAELISLNACETSHGQLKKGEGIICMAWAFTSVGARSLVTTLWEAEAVKAAPFIFNEFYGYLRKGISRDSALYQAKADFLSRRTGIYDPHPFYWAPFILTGETKPVKR